MFDDAARAATRARFPEDDDVPPLVSAAGGAAAENAALSQFRNRG
jgi:hypothetical protein